jgi:hypothetical protein
MRGKRQWIVIAASGIAIGIAAAGAPHLTNLALAPVPAPAASAPQPLQLAPYAFDIDGVFTNLRERIDHLLELGIKDDPSLKPGSLFNSEQIVSFYGHPLSPGMGALGQGTRDEVAARLRAQVAAYQALNPERTVVPAFHLIYEVAQAYTSDDGLYLYRTEDATVRDYIQYTQQQGMLLFLDLQIGRSTLDAELDHVLPYLKEPNVHLAIDPEFVTPSWSRPGLDIGTLDCDAINAALDRIEQLAEQENLPNKIVIVHQFQDSMLTHKQDLRFDESRVDTVLDMDGFGDQTGKLSKYDQLVRQAGARFAGMKLFYKQDVRLLSEQQVEGLDPRPNVIIYQ